MVETYEVDQIDQTYTSEMNPSMDLIQEDETGVTNETTIDEFSLELPKEFLEKL